MHTLSRLMIAGFLMLALNASAHADAQFGIPVTFANGTKHCIDVPPGPEWEAL